MRSPIPRWSRTSTPWPGNAMRCGRACTGTPTCSGRRPGPVARAAAVRTGKRTARPGPPVRRQQVLARPAPNAAEAGARALSKAGPEAPLLRATSRDLAATMDLMSGGSTAPGVSTEAVKLDDRSVAMIRSQDPQRYSDTTALERTVRHFEETIA